MNTMLGILCMVLVVGIIVSIKKSMDTDKLSAKYSAIAFVLMILLFASMVTLINNIPSSTNTSIPPAQRGLDKILLTKENLTATEARELLVSKIMPQAEVWCNRHNIPQDKIGVVASAIFSAINKAEIKIEVVLPAEVSATITDATSVINAHWWPRSSARNYSEAPVYFKIPSATIRGWQTLEPTNVDKCPTCPTPVQPLPSQLIAESD